MMTSEISQSYVVENQELRAKMKNIFDDCTELFYKDSNQPTRSKLLINQYKLLCEKVDELKIMEDCIAEEIKNMQIPILSTDVTREILKHQLRDDSFTVVQRGDERYNKWVTDVIKRDKVCQCCGVDKHLESHHIFGFKDYPTLRDDSNNGIALCRWCHRKYHSLYGIKGANPYDLANYMRDFGLR